MAEIPGAAGVVTQLTRACTSPWCSQRTEPN